MKLLILRPRFLLPLVYLVGVFILFIYLLTGVAGNPHDAGESLIQIVIAGYPWVTWHELWGMFSATSLTPFFLSVCLNLICLFAIGIGLERLKHR